MKRYIIVFFWFAAVPVAATTAVVSSIGCFLVPSYSDISKEIKQGVDYIVPEKFALKGSKKPSQIIKLGKSGEVQIIRE